MVIISFRRPVRKNLRILPCACAPVNECEDRLISIVVGDAVPRDTEELRWATVALLQRVEHFEYLVDFTREQKLSTIQDIGELEEERGSIPQYYGPIENPEKHAEQMLAEEGISNTISWRDAELRENRDYLSSLQDRLLSALSSWKHFECRYRNIGWILDEAAEMVWAPESDEGINGDVTCAELSLVPLPCNPNSAQSRFSTDDHY